MHQPSIELYTEGASSPSQYSGTPPINIRMGQVLSVGIVLEREKASFSGRESHFRGICLSFTVYVCKCVLFSHEKHAKSQLSSSPTETQVSLTSPP